jgi:hypothetical protein
MVGAEAAAAARATSLRAGGAARGVRARARTGAGAWPSGCPTSRWPKPWRRLWPLDAVSSGVSESAPPPGSAGPVTRTATGGLFVFIVFAEARRATCHVVVASRAARFYYNCIVATICPVTSSDAGGLCSILFPLPASQGRTHLRTSADCIACLCRSLTRVTGWVHAA